MFLAELAVAFIASSETKITIHVPFKVKDLKSKQTNYLFQMK